MKELTKIKYWLFDLDNTLYSGETKVFDQVDKKMSKFISEKLIVDIEEAKKIQKSYFHEYNTTLNGMIKNHKIYANEFLEIVHDVDIKFLKADKPLENEIAKLNGKKIRPFQNCNNIYGETVGFGEYQLTLKEGLVLIDNDVNIKEIKGNSQNPKWIRSKSHHFCTIEISGLGIKAVIDGDKMKKIYSHGWEKLKPEEDK